VTEYCPTGVHATLPGYPGGRGVETAISAVSVFGLDRGHFIPSPLGRGGPSPGAMGKILLSVCPLPNLSRGGRDPLPNIFSWKDRRSDSDLGFGI